MRALRGISRLTLIGSVLIVVELASLNSTQASESEKDGLILSVDHYVQHRSMSPSIKGQYTQLYVRERVLATRLDNADNFYRRVVLFVHGSTSPTEVAFDLQYENYSWMAFLAAEGFDVFGVDMTGYGRSTRPHFMNDPCNLSKDDRDDVDLIGFADCKPSYPYQIGTIASDWADIGAAVDYIRDLRGVDKVSLVSWSLGGLRAGGYAVRNLSKIDKMIFLAPAYNRSRPSGPPAEREKTAAMRGVPNHGAATSWDRQVGCEDQYDPAVRAKIFSQRASTDPVGATWGSGTYRYPRTESWGWNQDAASRVNFPTLIVAGALDDRVTPERARELYEDLGTETKVLIELACSSHYAPWEKNRHLLFESSLEWLQFSTVNGNRRGSFKMGD